MNLWWKTGDLLCISHMILSRLFCGVISQALEIFEQEQIPYLAKREASAYLRVSPEILKPIAVNFITNMWVINKVIDLVILVSQPT